MRTCRVCEDVFDMRIARSAVFCSAACSAVDEERRRLATRFGMLGFYVGRAWMRAAGMRV